MKSIYLLLLGLSISANTFAQPDQIFLLRHAEKQQGSNPNLTQEGKLRAIRIAERLESIRPTHLFSTDYNRTQQTIAPLAEKMGVEVTSYNPRALAAFAEQVKSLKGNIVIVGHSNTTPTLLGYLSGYKAQITEDTYHKLYELRWHNGKYDLIRHSSN